ncbi:MAG: hypothetical protein KatS3mg102_2094 [Planctomycetota bacterium]|nr:MAG: hypothetical protein KatS3mg102_2094 [Planctomycetota bacterium]
MAVRSYYCAHCGVKLRLEEARHGRPSLQALTFYCPSCVEEHGIRVMPPPPPERDPLLGPGRSGRLRVGPIDVRAPLGARERAAAAAGAGGVRGRPRRAVVWWAAAGAALGGGLVALGLLGALGGGGAQERGHAAAPHLGAWQAAPRGQQPFAASTGGAAAGEPERPAGGRTAPQPPVGAGLPPGEPAPPEADGFLGTRTSRIVHRPDCVWAARIAPANRERFADLGRARAEGYRACRVCLGEQ